MYEKEDEKDSICSWKCDPGNDVDGLGHSDWM